MNKAHSVTPAILLSVLAGILLGIVVTLMISGHKNMLNNNIADNKKEPLYWVAPMDSNYRRDKPGKSPMGMDLLPVYGESAGDNNNSPGMITISPDVINNLGVRTTKVTREKLDEQIRTVGYVKYDEGQLIHIHPRVSGWVEKLKVKSEGEQVKKNDPLYALYSPELVNAQEELLLALKRNDSRLIKATEDRLRALQISPSFINKLKQNKILQQTVVFYSPQDGVVVNLDIREGFYVQPGTTMLSIGSLNQVWVEAEVFEKQAAFAKEGQNVTMTLDSLPGKTWNGVVDYIYPSLDVQTRTLRLRLRFDNPDSELKPNMYAQLVIHSENEEPVLRIPQEALIRTGSQHRVVLALGEGRFKSIEVIAGQEDSHHVEILHGVNEGDKVVSSAQFLLDSESSKTSDFKRMHHADTIPQAVWVAGIVDQQLIDKRMVAVSHESIGDWNMSAMTMNFMVGQGVDIETLTPGTAIHMQIQKGDKKLNQGRYTISTVHIMDKGMPMLTPSSPIDPQQTHQAGPEDDER